MSTVFFKTIQEDGNSIERKLVRMKEASGYTFPPFRCFCDDADSTLPELSVPESKNQNCFAI